MNKIYNDLEDFPEKVLQKNDYNFVSIAQRRPKPKGGVRFKKKTMKDGIAEEK